MYNGRVLKKPLFLLLIILILATFLRIYQLDRVPPSLFGDEVDVGYQAYSLLKTGQDLMGTTWPILVHSLAEYRAPLFIYSDIPFVAVFGLNEWGVRLAAAFWGILGVFGLYLLVRKLFNQKLALWAAFFLAISPWHIHYSRAGFEVTMLLTFILFGTFFFLKGLEKNKFLYLSAVFYALTPYIYTTATIFMPLLVLSLLIIHKENISKRLLVSLLVAFLILAPYGLQLNGKAGERFSLISIFSNKDMQEKVTLLQQREGSGTARIFHNKPTVTMQNFTKNYLRAFSPEFLFLQGDPNFRQSIHEMGQMYFFEAILLFIGLATLLTKITLPKKVILAWLLLSPVPASLTYDGGFHATRDFLMLPPLMIINSLGISWIFGLKKKVIKFAVSGLLILAIFNFTFFLHRYFVDYPYESWKAWHFGFKETMQYIRENQSQYDKVVINNTYEPALIRFLFWSSYDPVKFHQEFKGDDYNGFSLNKFYFGKYPLFENNINNKTLFIGSSRDDITNPDSLLDKRVKLLKTITAPSGEIIFYVVTGTERP